MIKAYFYDKSGSCIRVLHNVKDEPEGYLPRALEVIRPRKADVTCLYSGRDELRNLVYRAEDGT